VIGFDLEVSMPAGIASLEHMDPTAHLHPTELAGLQLERLQSTLRHVRDNVPHYRDAFHRVGVAPEDVTELADLRHLPFTTKDDLRANYPFGLFAVPQSEVRRVHASSGTTGQPTVVGYSERDLEMWALVCARSIHAAGGRPGDKLHNAYGYGLFTGGLGVHYGAERPGCTVIPMSGGQTERQVRLINDFQPEIITVTPSYMLALLDEFERQGLDPKRSSLRIGIFGAEPWSPDMRREIEERAGLDAVDIYGLSEVIGPGVAMECVETKDGLHVWEDHFYPEIVDPDTGEVLPDGEYGELVFTSLTKQAMPVIRYRTRDLTRLLPGTARPVRRIEKITGRSDDMIILRGVNVFPTQVEELLLNVRELSPHYQLVLARSGRLDELIVRVESRAVGSPEATAALADAVCRSVKENIGVTVACEVLEPGALRRSEGKAQRVLDTRPPL
jgi:phenylacetate-CoA ligase